MSASETLLRRSAVPARTTPKSTFERVFGDLDPAEDHTPAVGSLSNSSAILSTQSVGTRQSSSVNAIRSAVLASIPTLRARAAPRVEVST